LKVRITASGLYTRHRAVCVHLTTVVHTGGTGQSASLATIPVSCLSTKFLFKGPNHVFRCFWR